MNWNRFNFGTYSAAGGDTIYEHDVKAIEKLYSDTSAQVSSIESQAEATATSAYAAGQKVAGAAGNVGGAAASGAMGSLDASAKG